MQSFCFALFLCLLTARTVQLCTASSRAATTASGPHGNVFANRWHKASRLAGAEQTVEDYNADYIARSSGSSQATRHRRLICLPLDERFDPPMGVFSHSHVQTGDKMSLPANFWQAIQLNAAEVPWLFSVKRVEGVTSERVKFDTSDEDRITECQPLVELEECVGGPLDFRAPSNYVFLPLWMMRALGIKPRDIVQVEMVESVPPGSLAKLRPHSADFAKDISNPQAVLETELRHYSSLTQGSVIAFDYRKKRYWFDVVELRSAPRGEKSPMVKVQDCDIATDFLTSRDVVVEQRRKKRQQKLEAEKEL